MFWFQFILIIVGIWLTAFLTEAVFSRWPKTGKWAITSGKAPCPNCGKVPLPIRVPKDTYEMMWGGNTCVDCGTKFDKHGDFRETE